MDGRFYNHALLTQKAEELKPNVTRLCQELGISRTHYYDILKGRSVSPEMLAQLCIMLEIPYREIIRLDPLSVG